MSKICKFDTRVNVPWKDIQNIIRTGIVRNMHDFEKRYNVNNNMSVSSSGGATMYAENILNYFQLLNALRVFLCMNPYDFTYVFTSRGTTIQEVYDYYFMQQIS